MLDVNTVSPDDVLLAVNLMGLGGVFALTTLLQEVVGAVWDSRNIVSVCLACGNRRGTTFCGSLGCIRGILGVELAPPATTSAFVFPEGE